MIDDDLRYLLGPVRPSGQQTLEQALNLAVSSIQWAATLDSLPVPSEEELRAELERSTAADPVIHDDLLHLLVVPVRASGQQTTEEAMDAAVRAVMETARVEGYRVPEFRYIRPVLEQVTRTADEGV